MDFLIFTIDSLLFENENENDEDTEEQDREKDEEFPKTTRNSLNFDDEKGLDDDEVVD
jgi:hypothetical protein